MNDNHKDMIKYLQDQIFVLHNKVQKQANEIEQYRLALSKIEEIVDQI